MTLLKNSIVVAMALLLAACSIPPDTDSAKLPKRGILIVYGRGFVPEYDIAKVGDLAVFASQVFATTLQSNLHTYEVPARIHDNLDRARKPRDLIPALLAREPADALVQVSVIHDKTETENNIYIQAQYTPLTWTPGSAQADVATLEPGVTRKYKVFSADKSFEEPSISGLAIRFCRSLRKEGFTRSSCEKF